MKTTNDATAQPLLLTRTEVAQRLSTSDRHIRRLIEDGRLPSVRLGGKVRVHQQQLDDFVARLCRTKVSGGDDRAGPPDTVTDVETSSAALVAPLPVIGK